MRIRIAVLVKLICLALFLSMGINALAEDRSDQLPKGVALIDQTVNMFCGKLAESEFSLKGNASAELNAAVARLVKLLADAKISVNAGATANISKGVSQTDLAADRKDTRRCNQHIFELMLPIVFDKTAYQPVPNQPRPETEHQPAASLGATKSKPKRMEAQSCGNDVWYVESKETLGTYSPMYVWRCSTSTDRKIVTSGAGLTVSDMLAMDRNRGQLQIEWAGTSVNWSTGNLLLTASLKNTGNAAVHVRSIDIIAKSGDPKSLALPFFSHNFVIFPSEKVLVPVAEVDALAKLVDRDYDNANYIYTASMETAPQQDEHAGRDELVTCMRQTMGFGLSVAFDDVFGDKYRLNRPAFLNKNKCVTSPVTYLNQPPQAEPH